MTSEGPRRSQRSTKGKGPNKFGWDKVPDSVSQARSRHTSSSFRSREIAMFRAGQSELETATKIAELEISSMRKELELRKELAEKRVALEKRAAELELPSSSSPSWEEGDSVGGDDVDLEDALGAEKTIDCSSCETTQPADWKSTQCDRRGENSAPFYFQARVCQQPAYAHTCR